VVVPPPPKMEAPPPPFIPPPEVQIATPPPPAPTITATSPTPPPQTVITPIAPPVTAPAPPAPAPAVLSAAVVCSNYSTAMGDAAFPKDAIRQGLEKGDATVVFTLTAAGEVKNVTVERTSHAIFGRASVRVVNEFKCQGQGRDVQVRVPFSFKLE
jgi:protein TonB